MKTFLLVICLSLSSVVCAAQSRKAVAEPWTQQANDEQLVACVKKGDLDCAAQAIAAGASANARTNEGVALNLAAEGKNASIVRLLLSTGAEVNKAEEGDPTPLCRAALFGREEIVAMLLAEGAKINVVCDGDHGDTPLMNALLGAWLSSMPVELREEITGTDDKDGGAEDSNATNQMNEKEEKWREVSKSPREDFIATARLLISRGADVNAVAECDVGETALTYAAMSADVETVKDLLSHGADVHKGTAVLAVLREFEREAEKPGRLTLPALSKEQRAMLAWNEKTKAAREEIMQLLKAAGAKDGEDDHQEHTESDADFLEEAVDEAFTSTIKKNDVKDLERLIEAYAAHPLGVKALAEALRTAVIYDRREMVKLLLARGADPNGARNGPLTHAVHDRNLEYVQLLLEAGADVSAANDNGGTVLDYAERWTNPSEEERAIIQALKAKR